MKVLTRNFIKVLLSSVLAISPLLLSLSLFSQHADAAGTTTLFASPEGSGSTCSVESPCSLTEAQAKVRTLNTTMTGDIVVYLRGGTYHLSSTFQLTHQDSGTGGFNVVYQAYPDETPILSGGQTIEDWSLFDAENNIYRSDVGTSLNTRQLYVNGARAMRAQGSHNPESFTKTATGFTSPDTSMSDWGNQSQIEVVSSNSWKSFRCPVESIAGSTITMQNHCWNNSQLSGTPGINAIDWFENAYELLDSAGEWYLDRAAGYLYYKPHAGEEMANAEVVAPTLETLLSGTGTLDTPIKNVHIIGLTFAYATWMQPSTSDGYVPLQAGFTYTGFHAAATQDLTKTPGNVTFRAAHNVKLERNTFTHLGGAGLVFEYGSQNNTIIGNVFDDISASGIQIGDVTLDTVNPADIREHNTHNTIENNYITHVGAEYFDGVGIFGGYTSYSMIRHNELANLPYTGITQGWGWGRNSYAQNNLIMNNYIHDVMKILGDGGGIYTLSAQKDSKISGNYLQNMYGSYGGWGVYPDEGSAYFEISNNVIKQTGRWISMWTGTIHDNIVHHNYTDNSNMANACTNCTLTDNVTVVDGNWPSEAQTIINNAGLQKEYWDLSPLTSHLNHSWPVSDQNGISSKEWIAPTRGYVRLADTLSSSEMTVSGSVYQNDNVVWGPRTVDPTLRSDENLALNRPAIAYFADESNATMYEGFEASKAVDGNINTHAFANGFHIWQLQVDLGSNQVVDRIVVTMPGHWYATEFDIKTSIDGSNFTTVKKVTDFTSGTSDNAIAETTARYVRVVAVKPDGPGQTGVEMSVSELEVYGPALTAPEKEANYQLYLKVLKGDRLRFVVQANENASLDNVSWNSNVKFEAVPAACDFTQFNLPGQLKTTINAGTKEILITVKEDVDITNLIPDAKVTEDCQSMTDLTVAKDFSQTVMYDLQDDEKTFMKKWKVFVTKESPKVLVRGTNINDAIADVDNWYVDGTSSKSGGEGNIVISDGSAVYKGKTFLNELLEFEMKSPSAGGVEWPAISIRQKVSDKVLWDPENEGYILVFKPEEIELQRFNGGKRTVFYGNIDGIIGSQGTLPNNVFEMGKKHLVQFGARNTAEGVKLVVYVDNRKIIDFVDKEADKVTSAGYLGAYAYSAPVTLEAVPVIYNISNEIADVDRWNTGVGTVEDESEGGITISNGASAYRGKTFLNELLEFEMKSASAGGVEWPAISIRQKVSDKVLWDPENEGYILVFKPGEIELQRFNGGKRTVFYGNVDGMIGSEGTLPNNVFEMNKKHLVHFGAVNTAEGVRLVAYVDNRKIIDYIDNGTDKVTSAGYMGVYALSAPVTISGEEGGETTNPKPRPGENLALNRPATAYFADGSRASMFTGFEASKAVDGKIETHALADGQHLWQLQVDLGSNQTVNRIVVKMPATLYATEFDIKTSIDGITFETVKEVKDFTSGTSDNIIAETKARYVRVVAVKPDGPYQTGLEMAVSELEVYNPIPPKPDPGEGGEDGNDQEETKAKVVVVEDGVAVVRQEKPVPVQLSEIGDRPFRVVAGSVSVQIDRTQIAAWRDMVDGASDAAVEVHVRQVNTAGGLNSAAQGAASAMKPAGQAYEVSIKLFKGNGIVEEIGQVTKGITITLPYAATGFDAELLGIYRYNERTQQWDYVGGEVDSTRSSLTVNVQKMGQFAVFEYNKRFDDVPETHWAARVIQLLTARQIVHGVSATSFQPEGHTTRAEFVALLVRTLNLELSENQSGFTDIAPGAWYAQSVQTAVEAGIVSGISTNQFAPHKQITRAEMVVMVARVLGLPEEHGTNELFSDAQSIPKWAATYVAALKSAGIIQGKGQNRFDPNANATRAEAAKLILSVLHMLKP